MSGTIAETVQRTDEEWLYRYGWRESWRPGPDGLAEMVRTPLTAEEYLHPQEGDKFMIKPRHALIAKYLAGVFESVLNGAPGAVVLMDVRVDYGKGVKPLGPDVSAFTESVKPFDPNVGTFDLEAMGAKPLVAVEITSPGTRDLDLDEKVLLYHTAEVRNYVIIDHRNDEEVQGACVLGYRWTKEGYIRVANDAQRRYWLEPMRIWIAPEGDLVRCYDEEGAPISTHSEALKEARQDKAKIEEIQGLAEEAILARQESERERKKADARAEVAELRLRELEAELAKLRPPA
ncbi:MAG: Uma2 family endonuclease [Gemmataceae bacterium]|nr:Uma2 family endonuclease [Gemmataceae bacterium]